MESLQKWFTKLVEYVPHTVTLLSRWTNGKGQRSAKKSCLEVLADIDDVLQISFPICGNRYITRYLGNYAYINLVESPGVAFIATTRPPGKAALHMISAVLGTVPLILMSACVAFISGFII